MIADYATTGLTAAAHPVGLLREELDRQGALGSAVLPGTPHNSTVRVGGLVVARQRPGTAKGVVFMLLEDEAGTINLIVPPQVYERHRLQVRTEPLVVAEGRLERHPLAGGQVNVLVSRLWALDAPDRPLAVVRDFSPLDLAELERAQEARPEAVAVGEEAWRAAAAAGAGGWPAPDGAPSEQGDFRAVAPPVMSFAQGRRR
jgi:error-prone DNA polymerase